MRQRLISQKPATDLPELFAAYRARQPEGEVKGKSWYTITNLSKDETEVFIYDEIGFWGVTAADFIKDIRDISTPKITLRINSPGGDVFDGVAIYNAIRRQDAEVNVFIDGLAASAASFIAMAGDTVTMSPKSQMMIHDAWGLVIGPADDMRKMADMLDKTSDNIASIYADRAGGTVEEWRGKMRDESWFSDQEAVDAGLADRIDGEKMPEKMPKKMSMKNEAEEPPQSEPEPEPDEEPEPEAVDFGKVFEDIAEEEQDALFEAVA